MFWNQVRNAAISKVISGAKGKRRLSSKGHIISYTHSGPWSRTVVSSHASFTLLWLVSMLSYQMEDRFCHFLPKAHSTLTHSTVLEAQLKWAYMRVSTHCSAFETWTGQTHLVTSKVLEANFTRKNIEMQTQAPMGTRRQIFAGESQKFAKEHLLLGWHRGKSHGKESGKDDAECFLSCPGSLAHATCCGTWSAIPISAAGKPSGWPPGCSHHGRRRSFVPQFSLLRSFKNN